MRRTTQSELVSMRNDNLKDQLKKHTALGKTSFTATQPNRTAYVLQLQTLLLTWRRMHKRITWLRATQVLRGTISNVRSTKKNGRKRKAGVHEWMGFEWTDEAIVGKVIADGVSMYAKLQTNARKRKAPSSIIASFGRTPTALFIHLTWFGISRAQGSAQSCPHS